MATKSLNPGGSVGSVSGGGRTIYNDTLPSGTSITDSNDNTGRAGDDSAGGDMSFGHRINTDLSGVPDVSSIQSVTIRLRQRRSGSSGGGDGSIAGVVFIGSTNRQFGTVGLETVATIFAESDKTASTDNTGAAWTKATLLTNYFGSFFNVNTGSFRHEVSKLILTLNFTLPTPTAVTDPALNIQSTQADLKATVGPNELTSEFPGTVTFEWGEDTGYGSETFAEEVSGTDSVDITHNITGLVANTPHNYRVKVVTDDETIFGDNLTFTAGEQDLPILVL